MTNSIHAVSDDSWQTKDAVSYGRSSGSELTDESDGPQVRVLIAVDAGRSSVRAACYQCRDARAEGDEPQSLVRAMEGIVHIAPVQSVIPGTGHVRVREVMGAIDECVDRILQLLRRSSFGYRVAGVGLSTFAMNLIGVDMSGDPVGDAATLSSACDGGSREDVVKECRRLIDQLGPEGLNAMHQRTGAPGVHPSYALPQLLAFYNNEQNNNLIRRIKRWQSVSCTIVHRWTGRPQIQIPLSFSEASRTGMLDFRLCTWDEEAMDLLEPCNDVYNRLLLDGDDDDDDKRDDLLFNRGIYLLPPITDHDATLPILVEGIPERCEDGTRNSYWERWPELRSASCQLFLGMGDSAVAAVGGGCADGVRRIDIAIQAAAAVWMCLSLPAEIDSDDEPGYGPPIEPRTSSIIVPPGVFCCRVDRARVLLCGTLENGGSVVEWVRSLLDLQSNKAYEACLAEVSEGYKGDCTLPPGSSPSSFSSSISMIPFLGGEVRTTGFRGRGRGCISGITKDTNATDVVRACLESVILRVAWVLRLLNGACPHRLGGGQGILVASGDALVKCPLWQQMLADCTSMEVIVDGDSGGSSRSIAIMMAGSLRQRELGNPMIPYKYGDEPLVAAHESKAGSPAAEKYWKTATSAQESLILAIAPTWSIG